MTEAPGERGWRGRQSLQMGKPRHRGSTGDRGRQCRAGSCLCIPRTPGPGCGYPVTPRSALRGARGLAGLRGLLRSLPAGEEPCRGQRGAGAGLARRGRGGPCGKESLLLLKADRMNFSLCPWQFFTAQLFHLGLGSQWKEARIASLTSHNI